MPEETEGQSLSQEYKQFIEVEAPERLHVGQNLYDQEPFSSIVKRICESTGKIYQLRTNISYFAEIAEKYPVLKDSKLQAIELIKEMGYRPQEVRIPYYYRHTSKMLETVQEALQMYPYWSEYIVQRRQDGLYAYNGNFVKSVHGKTEPPAISYANWVTQKLQREKRLWLVGIEEIFPQDVGHPTTSLPNITGIKPGNRRYKILKAAEIIK